MGLSPGVLLLGCLAINVVFLGRICAPHSLSDAVRGHRDQGNHFCTSLNRDSSCEMADTEVKGEAINEATPSTKAVSGDDEEMETNQVCADEDMSQEEDEGEEEKMDVSEDVVAKEASPAGRNGDVLEVGGAKEEKRGVEGKELPVVGAGAKEVTEKIPEISGTEGGAVKEEITEQPEGGAAESAVQTSESQEGGAELPLQTSQEQTPEGDGADLLSTPEGGGADLLSTPEGSGAELLSTPEGGGADLPEGSGARAELLSTPEGGGADLLSTPEGGRADLLSTPEGGGADLQQLLEGGGAEVPGGTAEGDEGGVADLNTLHTMLSVGIDSDQSSEEEEMEEFPTTLKEFNYDFNDNGELRNIDTNEAFVFEDKKGQRRHNQARYEALGEVITEVVYTLLESRGKLKRYPLPVDAVEDEPKSFFFMSEDAMTNPNKLLVLIHGSGVVRAGQWARSLIINHNLESGTQLPYIERGMKEGYGIMVLNTNLNYVDRDGRKQPIRENSTPQEHGLHVWQHFISKSKAKKIDIVAHSFGGVVTVDLVCEKFKEFQNRVHKIAFTDSVHSFYSPRIKKSMRKWMIKVSRNWVSSSDELDTPQRSYPMYEGDSDINRVSAGTTKHVETSWRAFDSVFKFFTMDK